MLTLGGIHATVLSRPYTIRSQMLDQTMPSMVAIGRFETGTHLLSPRVRPSTTIPFVR